MRLKIDIPRDNSVSVLYTSDMHIYHSNILKYDPRDFNNVDEMHLAIETRWNEVVRPKDIVIYLGDLMFVKKESEINYVREMLGRLNGEIHFVMGNHDKYEQIKHLNRFKTISDYLEVVISRHTSASNDKEETLFCCSHYPMLTWNKSHRGSICIHGHDHMALSDKEFHKTHRIFDVGCMGYNYYPVDYKDIITLANKIDYKLTNLHH